MEGITTYAGGQANIRTHIYIYSKRIIYGRPARLASLRQLSEQRGCLTQFLRKRASSSHVCTSMLCRSTGLIVVGRWTTREIAAGFVDTVLGWTKRIMPTMGSHMSTSICYIRTRMESRHLVDPFLSRTLKPCRGG